MNQYRPEIFISATTSDLGTCRKMIKEALITLGCSPIEQTNFPPAAGLVREMLRKRITGCHAVIHVVGEVYGAEPQERSEDESRRSYTQMEYDIACELGKDVYVFICDQEFPYDTHSLEGEEQSALQRLHRERLRRLDALYEPITSREQLEKRIYALPIRVEQLIKKLEATEKERDEAISRIQQTADYKTLKEKVEKAKRNASKLPGDPDFIEELQRAEEDLENFTQGIIKLVEEINRIPLNSERGKKARVYFEIGDYQAARDALDEKEMGEEKLALLKKGEQLKKQEEEYKTQLNDLAADYILKAKLTALAYQLGDERIPQTRQYFEAALELARTPEHLFEYALFFQERNQLSDSERLYAEALKIYRDLAKNKPTEYLLYVAMTLNNLGIVIAGDSSRRDEAKKIYEEAIETYLIYSSAYVKYNPTLGLPPNYMHMLTTLNNLRLLLVADDNGRDNIVEQRCRELLHLLKWEVKNNPAMFQPDLAMTLSNLGSLVAADSSRRVEAEKLFQEALKTYRSLVKNDPAIYLPIIANTLNAFGNAYLNWQQLSEALPYLQEAAEIFTICAQQDPEVFGRKLAIVQEQLQQAQNAK